MASRFIGTAIELNETIQQELCCSIHQGLLSEPMTLPCLHRFCKECLESWIAAPANSSSNLRCPNCNSIHRLPSDWKTRWFDRVLSTVTTTMRSTETEMNKKIIQFVQESFNQFGRTDQHLNVKSVSGIHNSRLKAAFEHRRKQLRDTRVTTLLHGTTRANALSISNSGFLMPTRFQRVDKNSEGELKFGIAIYFAHAKKATEYGDGILVLTDCVFGRVWEKSTSELGLMPDQVHSKGYDTIHFYNTAEGLVNQEWAIYRVDQCLPLCIIEYEIVDAREVEERVLIDQVKGMNYFNVNYDILKQALLGTDNQCKTVLYYLTDACSQAPSQSSRVIHQLLTCLSKEQIKSLFNHQNETIRILLLRALWHTGRRDQLLQFFFHSYLDLNLLIKTLESSYTDVSWRACGVLANMAASIVQVRHFLISDHVLGKLTGLLKRSIETNDKFCILTVTNLLANISCSEHEKMKTEEELRDMINIYLLDHNDEEVQEAGNRFFCNLIGQGQPTADWIRAGYKETVMAPDLALNEK